MKIVLTFLPELLFKNKFEPHGAPPQVIYLFYSVLKEAGFEVDIIDPYDFYQFEVEENLYEKCSEFIASKLSKDDIMIFSSNTFNWGLTKMMSNMISNKFPELKIVLGGLHPSIFDDYVLKVTKASVVIRCEGEKKLVEVLNALVNNTGLSDISGITYRAGNDIIKNPDCGSLTISELESAPLPDYSLLPKKARYIHIPVETSRGCKFSCAFCSIPHRHNWRGVSPNEVERKIKNAMQYKDRFSPISSILFVDDCFTADAERAKIIASKLKDLDLGKKYFIEVRATDVSKSDLFDSFDSRLIASMQVGVECGYDEGLKKIRKGLTVAKLYEALEVLHNKGFHERMFLSFIIGFPWEGITEINKTLDTIEYIATKFKILCNLNWLFFLPSDLWKEKEKYNINIDESIFDDPLWTNNRTIFDKTHPLLTEEIISDTEKRVSTMKENGLTVNFNILPFRHTLGLLEKK